MSLFLFWVHFHFHGLAEQFLGEQHEFLAVILVTDMGQFMDHDGQYTPGKGVVYTVSFAFQAKSWS